MTKIEINGKEYDFPDNWSDVDMKTYCNCFWKLEKTNDNMDEVEKTTVTLRNEATIISRLLGEADDFILSLPIQIFSMLMSKSRFIYEIEDFMDSKIFYLKIDGKKYWMPSPQEMSLRQYIDSDMIMREDGNKQQFIELLACLLLPYGNDGKAEYDGNYEELVPKIERMRASDALPFIYTHFKKKILSKKTSEAFSMISKEVDQHLQNIQGS